MYAKVLKRMLGKRPVLLAALAERWRYGVVAATIVAGLLTLGLLIRLPFAAEATVDIGGVISITDQPIDIGGMSDGDLGLVRFLPFEGSKQIEHFFTHGVFSGNPTGVYDVCTAKAVYSPNGLRLRVNCKGRSENQARELTVSALQPLLDRHARYYQLAKSFDLHRQTLAEKKMRGAARIIEVLRKPPVSRLVEAQIITHQLQIENLREQMALDRLLGNRVSPTQLDTKGVAVVDREPGLGVWIAVVVLALCSGVFMTMLAAMLRRIEHE